MTVQIDLFQLKPEFSGIKSRCRYLKFKDVVSLLQRFYCRQRLTGRCAFSVI